MGDPNETLTQTLQLLQQAFKDFERELPRNERAAYQELYRMAHRAMAPLNRRPDADYQRVAMMAMLVGLCALVMRQGRRLDKAETQLRLLAKLLEEHDIQIPPLRGARPDGPELDRVGQERLTNYPPPGPVPA